MLPGFRPRGVDEPFTNLLTQAMVCRGNNPLPGSRHLFPEKVREAGASMASPK
jgi:leucyl-tRNA synthetase